MINIIVSLKSFGISHIQNNFIIRGIFSQAFSGLHIRDAVSQSVVQDTWTLGTDCLDLINGPTPPTKGISQTS